MLTKKEFMEGVHILQNNYNKKLTTEQLQLYYENLSDLDKKAYMKNVIENIRNNEFMPNIAQLRNNKNKISNFEQRDYSEYDFNGLYAN